MASRAHVIYLQHRFRHDFALHAEKVVVNVGIPNALRQDNAGQEGGVRIERRPTSDGAGGLRARALVGIGSRSEAWSRTRERASGRGTGRRSVNQLIGAAIQRAGCEVERIEGWIPTGVGERIVERALVRDTKPRPQRCLAVTENVPSESHSRTKVVVVTLAQTAGCFESSRPADTSQHLAAEDSNGGRIATGQERSRNGIRCIAERHVGIRYLLGKAGARPEYEGGGQVVLFVMAGENVVAQAEIQGHPFGDLPVVLEIRAELQVPPMTDVGLQMGRTVGGKPGIYTCNFLGRGIGCEITQVKHFVGRTRNVEFAVFDVALDVHAHFDVVLPVANGDDIAVAVLMLFEELGVAAVRTKADCAVVEVDGGHARNGGLDPPVVLCVADRERIEDRGRKRPYVAQLPVGKVAGKWVREPTRAGRVAGPVGIGVVVPGNLHEKAVICVPVVIDTGLRFVAIKEVAERLGLGLEDRGAVVLNRHRFARSWIEGIVAPQTNGSHEGCSGGVTATHTLHLG